jgi:hypothetical protein
MFLALQNSIFALRKSSNGDATANVLINGLILAPTSTNNSRNLYSFNSGIDVYYLTAIASSDLGLWFWDFQHYTDDGKHQTFIYEYQTTGLATLAQVSLYPWQAGTFTKVSGSGPSTLTATKV